MSVTTELKQHLRKLRLSGMLPTLPGRLSYAKIAKLSYSEFLELIMSDEVDRRTTVRMDQNVKKSGINGFETFERFDWDAPISVDHHQIKDIFSMSFLEEKENVFFCGPVGVGKTYLANALGHTAIRKGRKTLMIRAETLFKKLLQARADYTYEREVVKYITPDLLIIDDFGLRKLTEQQSTDFYEIIVERYKVSSTVITSNRDVDEWLELFHDPLLANSTIDRLAHNGYRIIIEGDSYRKYRTIKK